MATQPWFITEDMVSAALAVLRASGRLQHEAEGVDQVLVWQMMAAAREVASSET